MLLSSWAFCSKLRSPVSETTLMAICCCRICQTGPSMWTTGGGHRKRFSLPYDFWATAACIHTTVVIGGARGILGFVFAHYATDFPMLIIGVPIIELPFTVRLLIVKSRDYVSKCVAT